MFDNLNPRPFNATLFLYMSDGTKITLSRSQFHPESVAAILTNKQSIKRLVNDGKEEIAAYLTQVLMRHVLNEWTRVNVIGWDNQTICSIEDAVAIAAYYEDAFVNC